MQKYSKVIIILLVILSLYATGIYLLTKNSKSEEPTEEKFPENVENIPNKNEPETEKEANWDYNFILFPKTVISTKDGKWQENNEFKYQDKLFDIYIDNMYLNKYYLTYSDNWKIFDENKHFYDYEGNFIGINTSKEFEIIPFNNLEISSEDDQIINNYLTSKDIRFNLSDLKKTKIIYDINRDGIRDEIFFVSNSFTDQSDKYNKALSIVFVKLYGNNISFYEDIRGLEDIYNIGNISMQNMILINQKIYFIVKVEYFSDTGTQHYVYEFSNNNLKEVLKTSINNN